ncbi:MAG: pirin family protein [Proteobacteria bacterium]|nr:pirin family protein [Pseudomonadota bacterium]MBI3496973.1 pirin family protein [Pseudomonadota bacterium]
MTIQLRPAEARGHANHGWLDTHHTFSFAHYYDPAHMGYRSLRVINDDSLKPGSGFPMHGHRDMEIVTYLVRGALAHKDTTGGSGVLNRGDVQSMTAGTGVRHSEFNASDKDDLRLLQIWILPDREGHEPTYRQTSVPDAAKRNTLSLLVAPDGGEGVLDIHQDVRIYASLLDRGARVGHKLASGRGAWIQVVDGTLSANGQTLKTGDGAAIEDVETIDIAATTEAEFLLFDLT